VSYLKRVKSSQIVKSLKNQLNHKNRINQINHLTNLLKNWVNLIEQILINQINFQKKHPP